MVSLAKYLTFSFLAASAVVYYAFATRQYFFPATVYLSTSRIAVAIMGNLAFACALFTHSCIIKVFLGHLRDVEQEMIRERLSSAVMESLLALTIFRDEFGSVFVLMFATLLFIKVLHWLVQDRVDYVEVTPTISRLQHVRIVLFMALLLLLDTLFLQYTVGGAIQSGGQSVMLLFAFEYVIQASTIVRYFVKYIFSMIDLALEGRWENKGIYVFYLELLTDFLHLSVYCVFFVIVFLNYGLPLHLVRELYNTFRNFRNRAMDFLRFRQVTARLDRFPDANADDLARCDGVCIICREEMVVAGSNKRLFCGHVFHVPCLRSWLERQQNCPTCRSSVFRAPDPPPAPPANEARPAGAGQEAQRPAAPAPAPAAPAPPAQPPVAPQPHPQITRLGAILANQFGAQERNANGGPSGSAPSGSRSNADERPAVPVAVSITHAHPGHSGTFIPVPWQTTAAAAGAPQVIVLPSLAQGIPAPILPHLAPTATPEQHAMAAAAAAAAVSAAFAPLTPLMMLQNHMGASTSSGSAPSAVNTLESMQGSLQAQLNAVKAALDALKAQAAAFPPNASSSAAATAAAETPASTSIHSSATAAVTGAPPPSVPPLPAAIVAAAVSAATEVSYPATVASPAAATAPSTTAAGSSSAAAATDDASTSKVDADSATPEASLFGPSVAAAALIALAAATVDQLEAGAEESPSAAHEPDSTPAGLAGSSLSYSAASPEDVTEGLATPGAIAEDEIQEGYAGSEHDPISELRRRRIIRFQQGLE